jgi:hypothetical protein
MRERISRFMTGRYGADDLAKFLNAVVLVCLILSLFGRRIIFLSALYPVAIVLMIYNCFRMFSKNISKRYQENQRFCSARYRFFVKKDLWKKHMGERRYYSFFKCPGCRQKVRVPKGRGKICITCPKCRRQFVKRS